MWENIYLYVFCFSVVFNLILYLFAYLFRTDKITDISYSLSFAIIAIVSFNYSARSFIDLMLLILVMLWALRLGSYLFYRILKIGRDERFDKIRVNPLSFFAFWLMQGMTCAIVSFPTVAIFSLESAQAKLGFYIMIGFSLMGFVLETVADYQKFGFKNQNPSKFMSLGVWKKIRHPNYTGELIFWWGIYFAGLFLGIHWTTIVGPLWMTMILICFSGVPILAKKWDDTYGHLKEYQDYKKNSWVLIPKIY